jgi:hypothetical protein
MSFAQDTGYTPATIAEIMLSIMNNVNTQFGTTYTAETFVGTNFYKYFYSLAQRMQENEVKTSEIFLKLQQYFAITNETIQRPVVTSPGVIENFLTHGYTASVKKMIDADAGKMSICVLVDDGVHATGNVTITDYTKLVSGTPDSITVGATVFTAQAGAVVHGGATFRAATSNAATATSLADQINYHATAGALVKAWAVGAIVRIKALAGGTGGNSIALAYTDNDANVGATISAATLTGGTTNSAYAATKLAINTIIKDCTVGGVVTQGTEVSSIVLTNGQSFDFKYYIPNKIDVRLRLTTVLSTNNESVIKTPDEQKATLLANIQANYSLGRNFEPQRYFGLSDAPWASTVLLEYSFDEGATYASSIYVAAFNDLFDINLAIISLVET